MQNPKQRRAALTRQLLAHPPKAKRARNNWFNTLAFSPLFTYCTRATKNRHWWRHWWQVAASNYLTHTASLTRWPFVCLLIGY